ncbi:unnamed protein product [Tilletia controversa]|nr:unnamed protein product [Tilletia controversa]
MVDSDDTFQSSTHDGHSECSVDQGRKNTSKGKKKQKAGKAQKRVRDEEEDDLPRTTRAKSKLPQELPSSGTSSTGFSLVAGRDLVNSGSSTVNVFSAGPAVKIGQSLKKLIEVHTEVTKATDGFHQTRTNLDRKVSELTTELLSEREAKEKAENEIKALKIAILSEREARRNAEDVKAKAMSIELLKERKEKEQARDEVKALSQDLEQIRKIVVSRSGR